MRGKRSEESKLKQKIRTLVWEKAFDDDLMSEVVNLLTPSQILSYFFNDAIPLHYVKVERGEVLSDNRGRGSWQFKPEFYRRLKYA